MMMQHFGIEYFIYNEEPHTLICGEDGGYNTESEKQCICFYENNCPDVLYYYHSDHIGSSTFLTDALGIPYQTPTTECWTQRNMINGVPSDHIKMHSESAKLKRTDEFMLYLPFGEAMAQQKVAGWATPYTFTGKEQDAATGLHYFGARYLDTRLSMFFGVDPLHSLFPNQTSYIYAYNNPVRYIDVDGLYGDEMEANKQRDIAKSQGLKVGDAYQSGKEWGFNVINGEKSYSVFDRDFSPDYSATQDNLKSTKMIDVRKFPTSKTGQGGYVIFGNGSKFGWQIEGAQGDGTQTAIDLPYFPGNYKSTIGSLISFRDDINELQNRFDIIPRDPSWVRNKGQWSHLELREQGQYGGYSRNNDADTLINFIYGGYKMDTSIMVSEKSKGFLDFQTRIRTIYDTRNNKNNSTK